MKRQTKKKVMLERGRRKAIKTKMVKVTEDLVKIYSAHGGGVKESKKTI